jgi:hypothetical protein
VESRSNIVIIMKMGHEFKRGTTEGWNQWGRKGKREGTER